MTDRVANAPALPAIRMVAAGIAALAVAMGIGRFAFTPLLPPMQAALGFGNDVAGWLASANHAGYLAGALAAAWLPAAWPRRVVAWWGLLAVIALTAAMAASESLAVWFVLRFLTGIASAVVLVFATATVLDGLRQQGRTDLAGVHFGGVGLGIALSGTLLAVLGQGIGWRGGWVAVAVLGLGLVAICRGLPPASPVPLAGTAGAAVSAPADRAHRQATWVLIGAYFLEGVGYIVTGTFLVAIARGEASLAPYAGWFWVVVGLAGAPSALLWTMAGRVIGPWRALMLAYGVQALGIVLPAVAPGLLPASAAFVVSSLLFGGTFMGITALLLPLGATVAPVRPDRVMALLTASFGLGQILGPIAAGQISAGGRGFAPALIAAAGTIAVGCALLGVGWRAARHWRQRAGS